MAHRSRTEDLERILADERINMDELRAACFQGVPDESGLRPKCWKVMLNYLPPKRADWESTLNRQRKLYMQWVQEMIIYPGEHEIPSDGRQDITCDDHPLNPNPQSNWSAYFKDNEVLMQIDKDARRLYPDMCFFQRPTDYPFLMAHKTHAAAEYLRKRIDHCVLKWSAVVKNRSGGWNMSSGGRKRTEYENLSENEEAHWEVVERMLFIYAKLNPGQSYVQGMNEIIGPIYYTFSTDKDAAFREHAEADTFFCFTNLMGEIRDRFIKHLDESASGIVSSMNRLMELLKQTDRVLWAWLEELDLKPQYYSFRWLTLLLSQEFALPEVLRLWDSLFADRQRFDFLLDISCAMIILIRDQLLDGDFASSMKLLQNYPNPDVHKILVKAVQLRNARKPASS
ncbi:TBC1 domain family member 13-like [Paramacrobiotus metropolitanus]|uniref:TBC1 domain family member 13-like n=1 Tax=Paramacrobiotus metropolitanus TaxID=2943436 RepID=UPI002445BECE|nr:TBC1 domain family member 13-like [Paramacrobiotus metropolitanus]